MSEIQIPAHTLSIVIPMYNEAENVEPMITRVHEGLAGYAHPWELILVDDGSSDATPNELRRVGAKFGPHVRPVILMRNFKQTAAMQAGIDAARGDVVVTLDGDLQNDPADIPRMVGRLLNEDLDMVAGWRKNRKDGLVLRKIPSRIANRLIARITRRDAQTTTAAASRPSAPMCSRTSACTAKCTASSRPGWPP